MGHLYAFSQRSDIFSFSKKIGLSGCIIEKYVELRVECEKREKEAMHWKGTTILSKRYILSKYGAVFCGSNPFPTKKQQGASP
jgi:hypothetical protein